MGTEISRVWHPCQMQPFRFAGVFLSAYPAWTAGPDRPSHQALERGSYS